MQDQIFFILKSAGIGLLSGIVVGFISKKVSIILVFFLAVAFVLLQIAIYNGYIHVDWLSLKETALNAVKNADISTTSLKVIILRNLPFSIVAIAGFIFGLKKG